MLYHVSFILLPIFNSLMPKFWMNGMCQVWVKLSMYMSTNMLKQNQVKQNQFCRYTKSGGCWLNVLSIGAIPVFYYNTSWYVMMIYCIECTKCLVYTVHVLIL